MRALLWLAMLPLLSCAPRPARPGPAPPAAGPEAVLLDSDSAYFADDGVALAMLLQRPERFRLDGVTLVAGNYAPRQGFVYLAHVAELLGRPDVPFYLGADHPLVNDAARAAEMKKRWGLGFTGAFGRPAPVAGRLDPPSGGKMPAFQPRQEGAVEHLIAFLDGASRPPTILAIGPLTNLALALKRRPDLAGKIGRLVVMGGAVRVPGNVTKDAEFNFWFDPEAASAVLAAPIREKVLVALDLTDQALVDRARFDDLTASGAPLAALFKEDLGEHYPHFLTDPKATRYVWDALASAYLVDPGIVTGSETLPLDVVTEFGPRYGAVRVKDRSEVKPGQTPVTVPTRLDFSRFYSLLKAALAKAS